MVPHFLPTNQYINCAQQDLHLITTHISEVKRSKYMPTEEVLPDQQSPETTLEDLYRNILELNETIIVTEREIRAETERIRQGSIQSGAPEYPTLHLETLQWNQHYYQCGIDHAWERITEIENTLERRNQERDA